MGQSEQKIGARKTLESLAELPDIANDVKSVTIEDNIFEEAHIDEWTRLEATESIRTKTFPLTEYQEKKSHYNDFSDRYSHAPQGFTKTTEKAIEQSVEPHTCTDCDGVGTNQCDECGGSSILPCPNNCGNGRVQCPKCRGTMNVECSRCYGKGRTDCSNCKGSGETNCGNCNWQGNVDCTNCSYGTVKCGTCNGSGSTGSGDSSRTCPDCHGDGKRNCNQCHGDNSLPCPKCGGSGNTPCSKCSGGTTPCGKCSGSGSVSCTNCSNGSVTCSECSGESTVPCGCGNGRIDCKTCETDGQLVTARTSIIWYVVNTEEIVQTNLVGDNVLTAKGEAEEVIQDYNLESNPPNKDGQWIVTDKRVRNVIPVRKVEYTLRGATYDVKNINGELHFESAPESERLKQVRDTLHEQQEEFEEEYRARVKHLERAIERQRTSLTEYYENRQQKLRMVKYMLGVLLVMAAIGAYQIWSNSAASLPI